MAKRKRTAGDMQHNREESIFDLAVVGAGASGCMAAYAAAQDGAQILLLDANDKIGRKLYATGNGRCNLTNLHMDDNGHPVGGGGDLSALFAGLCGTQQHAFWGS